MKAIALSGAGGPENFEMRDIHAPAPRTGEILVRIRAIGFNPVDAQIRRKGIEASGLTSPILGRDFSGVVEQVHPSVQDLRVGDEVFGNVCRLASSGTYAQYVTMPAELAAIKPAGLDHEHAAAIPVAGITAMLCLRKAALAKGKSLLVAGGSGGVGTFCTMLSARVPGALVYATAGSDASGAYLSETCGVPAEHVIDYRHHDWEATALRSNRGPFDAVIDLVGGNVLGACCRMLGLEGNLVSATQAPTPDDFEFLFDRNASFHPVGAHSFSLSSDRRVWLRYRHMLEMLGEVFSTGLPRGAVTVVGPFEERTVTLAHRLLEDGHVKGKLVMCA